jgi:hypothetical protein
LVTLGSLVSIPALAGPEEASPNLLAAMKALEKAKTEADTTDPTTDLQEALKDLDKATNNAGGKRDKAIDLVNEALKMAKDMDKTEFKAKVEHAITELHMGMDRGGHRRLNY